MHNDEMKYRRVVILDSVILYPEHRARLDEIADEVVEYDTCHSEEEVIERCRGADCIISCWVNVPNSVIDQNPQLKTIAFWTHAFEHRIDWEYAEARVIHVPAIPDYGTDSVAELVFIALLRLLALQASDDRRPNLSEAIVGQIGDDLRRLSPNAHDNLDGRWLHEYLKTGRRRMASADDIPEEALKGLTIGLLGSLAADDRLVHVLAEGFGVNVVHSLSDVPYNHPVSFRPFDSLADEAAYIVFDSRELTTGQVEAVRQKHPESHCDVVGIDFGKGSLGQRSLGIFGLGRIGGRVAQIAREGFGMPVRYHSRTRKPHLEEKFGLEYMEPEVLLGSSDIVSIHLPHHGANNMLTRDLVNRIPSGSAFVNASVGNVIEDENALLDRFRPGDLIGFLDVYSELPPRKRLREAGVQLLSTYRLGWRTKSTVGLKTHKLISKMATGLARSRSDSAAAAEAV